MNELPAGAWVRIDIPEGNGGMTPHRGVGRVVRYGLWYVEVQEHRDPNTGAGTVTTWLLNPAWVRPL